MLENYLARPIQTIEHRYIEIEITGTYKKRFCIPVDEDTDIEDEFLDKLDEIEIDDIEFDYQEIDYGYTYEYV